MGRFRVYHIARDGGVAVDFVFAETKAEASRLAHEKFDDVLKVKRTGHPWLPACIAAILLLAFVAICVLAK